MKLNSFIYPLYYRKHSVRKVSFYRSSIFRNRRGVRGAVKTLQNKNICSSESENPYDELNILHNSCGLKIMLSPKNFDYFTSNIHDDNDEKLDSILYEPRRKFMNSKKLSPLEFMDEKIKDVMQSKATPYEFNMLIIQVLTSLCISEQSFTIATGLCNFFKIFFSQIFFHFKHF